MAGQSVSHKATTQVITTTQVELPNRSTEAIRRDLETATAYAAVNAVQIAAVFACARVIAEGIANIPVLLQRYGANTGHTNAYDHPLFALLHRSPNSYQTAFEFKEWLGFELSLTGNAFVYVSRNTKGQPIELIPLAQSSVQVLTNTFGEISYRLNVKGMPAYTNKNVWHLRGPSLDSFNGVNPQLIASSAIALAADQEMFGSNLFRNGAKPSGMLTTEADLSKEQALFLKEQWEYQQSGVANAHRTALLTNGMKFQPIQTTANEAQFIESRRYQTEEICRVMRVDPLMIQQATQSASYASVEQRFLAHDQNTLGPWMERVTQSCEVNLLTRAEQSTFRVHADRRASLKTNAIDQATYANTLVAGGIMTRNEAREMIGMDRSNDPDADKLTPAQNLFGKTAPADTPSS